MMMMMMMELRANSSTLLGDDVITVHSLVTHSSGRPPPVSSGGGGPTLRDIFVVPQRILMAPGCAPPASQLEQERQYFRGESLPFREALLSLRLHNSPGPVPVPGGRASSFHSHRGVVNVVNVVNVVSVVNVVKPFHGDAPKIATC